MNITGAELITRYLERQDLAVVAGAAGVTLRPLARSLAHSPIVHAPLAQSSVRLASSATALRTMAEHAPALCIAGQVPRAEITAGMLARRESVPGVKAWLHAAAAFELLALLPQAWALAQDGQPGSVVLEVPVDVLTENIEGAWIPQCAPGAYGVFGASGGTTYARPRELPLSCAA